MFPEPIRTAVPESAPKHGENEWMRLKSEEEAAYPMPTTWLQPARGFDSIISYPHNSASSVLFSDVLQMKVSGIKQLSPGCTAHMHTENLASVTSKHVPYLCKHCLDSPQPTHNGQRSTYQPPRVTPIHLPLDGPSNMKTCQK